MPFQPVVLSGPSGSGKSTLLKKLMAEFDGCFAFSVSHTTRKPREGEKDGIDYNFVSREDMEGAIGKDEFIEHAEFSGNLYGTSKNAVQEVGKTGKICVLDIDMQGVKSVKATDLNPRYIFIQPPTIDQLEQRLRGRGSETEDSLKLRLGTAQSEMNYAAEKGSYDHIVINDNVDVAYEKLKGILIKDIDALIKDRHRAY